MSATVIMVTSTNIFASTDLWTFVYISFISLIVKRGRGRPRRNPPPGGYNSPIPAFIIPSPSGGQAVMMAPISVRNDNLSKFIKALSIHLVYLLICGSIFI